MNFIKLFCETCGKVVKFFYMFTSGGWEHYEDECGHTKSYKVK